MTRRKHQSGALKLEVALLQLGLDPKTARLDHAPALGLREKIENPDGTVTYVPDENDPKAMQWLADGGEERAPGSHNRKTFGSKATSAGSDIANIAKVDRIRDQQAEFRRRLTTKAAGEPPPRSRWGKRKMRSKKRGR